MWQNRREQFWTAFRLPEGWAQGMAWIRVGHRQASNKQPLQINCRGCLCLKEKKLWYCRSRTEAERERFWTVFRVLLTFSYNLLISIEITKATKIANILWYQCLTMKRQHALGECRDDMGHNTSGTIDSLHPCSSLATQASACTVQNMLLQFCWTATDCPKGEHQGWRESE